MLLNGSDKRLPGVNSDIDELSDHRVLSDCALASSVPYGGTRQLVKKRRVVFYAIQIAEAAPAVTRCDQLEYDSR